METVGFHEQEASPMRECVELRLRRRVVPPVLQAGAQRRRGYAKWKPSTPNASSLRKAVCKAPSEVYSGSLSKLKLGTRTKRHATGRGQESATVAAAGSGFCTG